MRILPSSSKNSKKNLDFYSFVIFLCLFLFLKNDVNVPLKSKKQKNLEKKYFLLESLMKRAGSGAGGQIR
jgi:hypothetical protein